MSPTRRTFLKAVSASALSAGFGLKPSKLVFGQTATDPYGGYPVPYEATTNPVFYYNRETFEPYVGSDFVIEGGRLLLVKSLTLNGITDWQALLRAHRVRTHKGECFSLHFQGGSSTPVPARTYLLSHSALGKFQLFLVGRESSRGGAFYEGLINHIA
jgi:hypothetical protein